MATRPKGTSHEHHTHRFPRKKTPSSSVENWFLSAGTVKGGGGSATYSLKPLHCFYALQTPTLNHISSEPTLNSNIPKQMSLTWISFRMAPKSVKRRPGICKNSPHSINSVRSSGLRDVCTSCKTRGRRVQISCPLGKKSRPTSASKTLDLPLLWLPTTATCRTNSFSGQDMHKDKQLFAHLAPSTEDRS